MRFARFSSAAAALSLALAVAAEAENPTAVVTLTTVDFEQTVNPENLILVEFYAPWCGHCKALAPQYDEASLILKDKGITLAKVDCVDQADLCQQHGVSGYPTLKIFRKGNATAYNGPRKSDGIISYMVKQSLPAVTTVTADKFDEFKKADKMVLVAFVDDESSAPATVFKSAAEEHRDDYLFGLSTDVEVLKAAGVTAPAIVLYRSFDEPTVTFSKSVSSVTSEQIIEFLNDNKVPLLDEVSQDNYAVYAESGLPLAYLFVSAEDSNRDQYIADLKPVAQKYKGKINFVTIDAVKFVEHGKALNLDAEKFPAFVIQDLEKQLKYPLSQDKELTASAISKHTDQYVAGKLEPILKSEPIPETQEGPVHVLVGKNFDQDVFDDKKDVFVEFYAPWCGHCKRLAPIWDSLAERYDAAKDTLLIAKMDATENDLPPSVPFRVSGFPTLKFKPAGSRDFVDYEGDRSLESLIEFVEGTAKNPIPAAKPAAASPKVDTEEAQVPLEHEHDEL